MSKREKRTPRSVPADDYLDLVTRCPLKPLRSEREYDDAAAMLDTLVLRNLSVGEQDYLDALTHFIEEYDRRNRRQSGLSVTPLGVLKHLMEENSMSPSDLGSVLGSVSATSMILHGQRGMSKSQMKKLAKRFRVEPGLFF